MRASKPLAINRREAMGTLAGAAAALGLGGVGASLGWAPLARAATPPGNYPAPRSSSYLKEPKTAAEILPQARALVRNKSAFGGSSPGVALGMLNSGDEILAVTDTTADDLTVEAMGRALEERGHCHFIPDYQLAGVSRSDAELLRQKTEIRSADYGYMEAKYYWIERVWADPEAAYDTPGYWHLWEVALGTEPKYFRNPKDMYGGGTAGIYCLTYERYRSGVFHWGLGNELASDPGANTAKKWDQFCADHKLPSGHDFHVQNYFTTYRARLRGSRKWINLVDRGHLTALDDPEVRALAKQYGDPDEVLAEAWVPDVPGINAPGSYAEYSRNPWPYADAQMKKILNGTYPYYYSPKG